MEKALRCGQFWHILRRGHLGGTSKFGDSLKGRAVGTWHGVSGSEEDKLNSTDHVRGHQVGGFGAFCVRDTVVCEAATCRLSFYHFGFEETL